jgi:hypothetical protein
VERWRCLGMCSFTLFSENFITQVNDNFGMLCHAVWCKLPMFERCLMPLKQWSVSSRLHDTTSTKQSSSYLPLWKISLCYTRFCAILPGDIVRKSDVICGLFQNILICKEIKRSLLSEQTLGYLRVKVHMNNQDICFWITLLWLIQTAQHTGWSHVTWHRFTCTFQTSSFTSFEMYFCTLIMSSLFPSTISIATK